MKLLFVLMTLLATQLAFGANVKRLSQDVKLPTQKVLEFQEIDDPAAAGTTDILNASVGPTSAAVTVVSTFAAQPDVPRNLVITPGATTADVAACTITITGTNINGATITEDFAFLDNASTATTGAKAFKTVTSMSFAAACEDTPFTAKWSIGWGEKLGLKRCMANSGHTIQSLVGTTIESTRPTCVADDDEVEKNTCDFNGTMNGSNDFDLFFIQNYNPACFP